MDIHKWIVLGPRMSAGRSLRRGRIDSREVSPEIL